MAEAGGGRRDRCARLAGAADGRDDHRAIAPAQIVMANADRHVFVSSRPKRADLRQANRNSSSVGTESHIDRAGI